MKFCLQLATFLITVASVSRSYGQADTSARKKTQISLAGFADVYTAYDFNRPATKKRLPFLYNHNRHNGVFLNLAYLRFSISREKFRLGFAPLAGTYQADNYAAERGLLKYLFEASLGFALNKKNTVWLDAGVFPSHIGFESAVSSDNWTLTRSLLAENSPYFESGAKLAYTGQKKLEIVFLVLSGWQRIQPVRGSTLPAVGSKLTYTAGSATILNWSTFAGTADPDSIRRMRYFHNLYAQTEFSKKLGLIAGFDLGMQQVSRHSTGFSTWYSPVLILRYQLSKAWKLALRTEYYQDAAGIIIPTGTAEGFRCGGISLNADFLPAEQLLCRIETRWLGSRDKIFESAGGKSDHSYSICLSLAARFSKALGKHRD